MNRNVGNKRGDTMLFAGGENSIFAPKQVLTGRGTDNKQNDIFSSINQRGREDYEPRNNQQ